MDIFGGGFELRPWEVRSNRAVHDHCRGRWIHLRRWIPHDGSLEDVLLGVALAVPVLVAGSEPLRDLTVVLLLVSFLYAVVRNPIATVTEWFFARVPRGVLTWLPDRFLPFEDEFRDRIQSL